MSTSHAVVEICVCINGTFQHVAQWSIVACERVEICAPYVHSKGFVIHGHVMVEPTPLPLSSALLRRANSRLHANAADRGIIQTEAGGVLDLSSCRGMSGLGIPISVLLAGQQRASIACARTFTCPQAEQFAAWLLSQAQEHTTQKDQWDRGGVVVCGSAGEANELACRLALQACHAMGRKGKPSIIVRHGSSHGDTLAALALGTDPAAVGCKEFRAPTVRVPAFAPSWLGTAKPNTDDEWATYVTDMLAPVNEEAKRCAAESLPCIVLVEPIAGILSGIEPATHRYLKALRELCNKHGAVLVYDETFCGNWRTGYPYCWQVYQQELVEVEQRASDVAPDIVTLGPSLSDGLVPIGAVVVSSKTREQLGNKRSYQLSVLQDHGFVCQIAHSVQQLHATPAWCDARAVLAEALAKHVDAINTHTSQQISCHGAGLLWGIRLAPKVVGLHARAASALLDHNIHMASEGQTFDGAGNTLLLAPSYSIQLGDLSHAVGVLLDVLRDVT